MKKSKTPYADKFVAFQSAVDELISQDKMMEIVRLKMPLTEKIEMARNHKHTAKVKVLALYNELLTKCQQNGL
jgi:hypothetical protein